MVNSNQIQKGGSASTGEEGKVEIDADSVAGFEDTASNAVKDTNQLVSDAAYDHHIDHLHSLSKFVPDILVAQ